jgi:hypothetical protein
MPSIVNNTNFSEINNLLSHGHDMDYIARHYHMDLALAWATGADPADDAGQGIFFLDQSQGRSILAHGNKIHISL